MEFLLWTIHPQPTKIALFTAGTIIYTTVIYFIDYNWGYQSKHKEATKK